MEIILTMKDVVAAVSTYETKINILRRPLV